MTRELDPAHKSHEFKDVKELILKTTQAYLLEDYSIKISTADSHPSRVRDGVS